MARAPLRGGTATLRRRGDRVVKRARPGFADVIDREGEALAALAALAHPNVVRLIARAPGALTLGWVEGTPLSALAGIERGALLVVARDVASALAAVHRAGLVHGDVSPSNVIVDRAGRATLVDFGSARRAGEPAREALGKRAYLAPEQLRAGAPVDGRADLFALGVLLGERLGGEPLVAWLTAPDPRRRPASAEAVAAILEAALR